MSCIIKGSDWTLIQVFVPALLPCWHTCPSALCTCPTVVCPPWGKKKQEERDFQSHLHGLAKVEKEQAHSFMGLLNHKIPNHGKFTYFVPSYTFLYLQDTQRAPRCSCTMMVLFTTQVVSPPFPSVADSARRKSWAAGGKAEEKWLDLRFQHFLFFHTERKYVL